MPKVYECPWGKHCPCAVRDPAGAFGEGWGEGGELPCGPWQRLGKQLGTMGSHPTYALWDKCCQPERAVRAGRAHPEDAGLP